MTAQTKNRGGFWQNLLRRDGRKALGPEVPTVAEPSQQVAGLELEIAPNDPILVYLASVSGVVEIEKLDLDSPALAAMKEAGVALGEVLFISASVGGMPVHTGVRVIYADEESFTVMAPEGHPESGWNTISAYTDEDGTTVAPIQSRAPTTRSTSSAFA